MKILAFNQQRVFSGDSIFLTRLIEHWPRSEDEFEICALMPDEFISRFNGCCPVERLDPSLDLDLRCHGIAQAHGIPRLAHLAGYYGRIPLALARLRAMFRRKKPDAVLINSAWHPGWVTCRLALCAARLAKVPRILYVFHNWLPFHGRGIVNRRMWPLLDQTLRGDNIVALTFCEAVLNDFSSSVRARDVRTSVVPHPVPDLQKHFVDVEALRRQFNCVDGPMIVSVGLLEERKGHRFLLEAWSRIAPRHTGARLILVGEGEARRDLEQFAREHGIEKSVEFTGHRSDATAIIAAADLFVLPSIAGECSPLVVLEAMSAGKAVIASRIAGTPEQVDDGVSGILTPPGDAQALSDALDRLLGSPELRVSMGRRGRERWALRHEPRQACRKIEALLLGRPENEI